ncbi:dTTP/UTP pyrophosphatase-like [Dysidea avara]|uniref:dTTP/UTP pyrophosphatase-like n=1 Tax=Dysidea avara TaxID=196820 RepID=UPI00331AED9E
MISILLHQLAGRRMILASTSPRRLQILESVGFPFTVVPSKFPETLDKASFASPAEYAIITSKGKSFAVAERWKLEDCEDWVVITGADTVVEIDGVILEKPKNNYEAHNMLQNWSGLSGRTHLVHTGVSLVKKSVDETKLHCFHEQSEVTFSELTFSELNDDMITAYVESGEPLDKAGAYGIQGLGGTLVKRINGDYYNVEGLPLYQLCKELNSQLKIWTIVRPDHLWWCLILKKNY